MYDRAKMVIPIKNETFEIFAQICEMMCAGEHLSPDGVRKIIDLRNLMNNETSKRHRDDEEILNSLNEWESSETIR